MPCIILGTEDTVVNKREKPLPLWGFSGETINNNSNNKRSRISTGLDKIHVSENILERLAREHPTERVIFG